MSAFSISNNGAYTTNYTNDTMFIFIGQGLFTQPNDWTQIQSNTQSPVNVNGVITISGTSSWTISGTGGSGKILSMKLVTDTNEYSNKTIEVVLKSGGGTFTSGQGNTFNPPVPSVACFVEGTRILTQNGYKAIEKLQNNDFVMTSDNRLVDFKIIKTTILNADENTAPYIIKTNAFGKKIPSAPVCLSATHKILTRNKVWTYPKFASKTNKRIFQYGIGKPVTYYHIECADYLKDNLVTEELIVESYGSLESFGGKSGNMIYTFVNNLDGFTRKFSGDL